MEETDKITPIQPSGRSVYSEATKTPGRGSPDTDNPFATPVDSAYPSHNPSSVALPRTFPVQERFFHSRRIKKEDIEKPWLKERKDPRQKWLTLIPLVGFIVGICLGGYMVYDGWTSVPENTYCSVYEDNFSSGVLNDKIWLKEVEVGGYGNGQFEETTNTDENIFIKDGMLHIKPTLQDEKLLTTNNVLNLTELGSCTSNLWYNCITSTNTTNGTIIPPVKSGRLSTRIGAHIKYGRVEVQARLPTGDWLWPAIWMLPVNETYGAWPQSGEIDIAESRGNNYTYPLGGNNVISGALHWGPDATNDAWWRTFGKKNALHSTFNDKFHTFGVEWSEKYIYTYVDTRLMQVFYKKFNHPLWKQGAFPLSNSNGTSYVDPWSQTGRDSTPFDQDFYLIMNVAVGGTNGWFEDGANGKPWVDASPSAKRDFWNARNQWYPTWQKNNGAEMVVRSVKMWQQKGYNGC